MKNYGFKIIVNDQEMAKVGFDTKNYVANCILDTVHRSNGSEEIYVYSGGLDSDKKEHVHWYRRDLELGDKIVIEVIEGPFDPPKTRSKKMTSEEMLQNKLEHYYQLKEELKEHLKDH